MTGVRCFASYAHASAKASLAFGTCLPDCVTGSESAQHRFDGCVRRRRCDAARCDRAIRRTAYARAGAANATRTRIARLPHRVQTFALRAGTVYLERTIATGSREPSFAITRGAQSLARSRDAADKRVRFAADCAAYYNRT